MIPTTSTHWGVAGLGSLVAATVAAIEPNLAIWIVAAIGAIFTPIVGDDKPMRRIAVEACLAVFVGIFGSQLAAHFMYEGIRIPAAFGCGIFGPTLVYRGRAMIASGEIGDLLRGLVPFGKGTK